MSIPNLKELMMSISDVKMRISEIVSQQLTKVIVKNNEAMSIILPYITYLNLTTAKQKEKLDLIGGGQDITLPNGIVMKVCAELGADPLTSDGLDIIAYVKMKSSGEYKVHYTLHLGAPNKDQELTLEEQMADMHFPKL